MVGGPPISFVPPGYYSQPSFVPPGGFAQAPRGFVQGSAPVAPQEQTRIAMPPPPPARFPTAASGQMLARARPDREPETVTLPSPDQLGVAHRAAGEVDWAETKRRMQELGVVGFRLDALQGGGYRFICELPSGQADSPLRLEGQGQTQGEAVRAALERARR